MNSYSDANVSDMVVWEMLNAWQKYGTERILRNYNNQQMSIPEMTIKSRVRDMPDESSASGIRKES